MSYKRKLLGCSPEKLMFGHWSISGQTFTKWCPSLNLQLITAAVKSCSPFLPVWASLPRPMNIYPDSTFNLCCCLGESRVLEEQWSRVWGAKISIKSAECWIAPFIGLKSARHKVSSGSVFLLSCKGKFFFFKLHSVGMLNTSEISAWTEVLM